MKWDSTPLRKSPSAINTHTIGGKAFRIRRLRRGFSLTKLASHLQVAADELTWFEQGQQYRVNQTAIRKITRCNRVWSIADQAGSDNHAEYNEKHKAYVRSLPALPESDL